MICFGGRPKPAVLGNLGAPGVYEGYLWEKMTVSALWMTERKPPTEPSQQRCE
jgi:hypothetical protein